MSSKMNRQLVRSSVFVILGIGVWLAISDNAAHGRPSFGGNCANCHSNVQEGLMQVTDEDTILDLGTQLDGSTPGPLKTFNASPGETVSLSMEVLNGSPDYALELQGLETGGQQNDQANKLVWTEANDPGNVWTERGNPPYFTKDNNGGGIAWGGTPVTYSFDLQIDPSTPVDVYELEFAIATGAFSYEDENFYLNVVPVPEPSSVALIVLGIVGIGVLGRRRARR